MPLFLIAVVVLFVDLLSKYIIQANMELHQSIPVIENIFHITYILNPGAAFGMLANKTAFFIAITGAVIVAMLVFYKQIKQEGLLTQIALGMVAGGALGNLIDRVRYGEVVDFLDFRIWPIFNLADVSIVTGVGLLIWHILRHGDREEKDNAGNS